MGSVTLDELLAAGTADLPRWGAEELLLEADAHDAFWACLDTPQQIKRMWQECVRRPPAELHSRRSGVAAAFFTALAGVSQAAQLSGPFSKLTGGDYPKPEALTSAAAELAAFVGMIFSRWTSEDDLVELMADTFELPKWLTEGNIPPHLQPPQSWYDETIDPSQPAAG